MLSIMNNPQVYQISFKDTVSVGRTSIYRKTNKGIEWVLESVKQELKKTGLEAHSFCVSNLTQSD